MNLLILVVLMGCSYLREQPLFWTNEGDFPIWMRGFVLSAYYPLLALELILLTVLSGLSVHLLSIRAASAGLTVVFLPVLWGLFFLVIVNSVANNLENLVNGRPLHWHPDPTWYQL